MNSMIPKYLLLFLLLNITQGSAQDVRGSDVPGRVVAAFKSKYPGAFVYEWEFKKKEKRYEGEFMDKGIKREASFSPDGTWLWTSRDMERQELPLAVSSGLSASEYGKWKIDDIEERQAPNGTTYLLEAESGNQEMILYFLSDGTFQRAEKK